MMIMNVFLSAFGKVQLTPCIKYVQSVQGCAVQIKHIISTSEDVQCKQVNHQVSVQGDNTQKYFSVNDESLLLLTHPVKTVFNLRQDTKSINYEISKEIFSF